MTSHPPPALARQPQGIGGRGHSFGSVLVQTKNMPGASDDGGHMESAVMGGTTTASDWGDESPVANIDAELSHLSPREQLEIAARIFSRFLDGAYKSISLVSDSLYGAIASLGGPSSASIYEDGKAIDSVEIELHGVCLRSQLRARPATPEEMATLAK